MSKAWIGVDLDRTLAEYHDYPDPATIGPPIPKMVARVKRWLAQNKNVKLCTARANPKSNGRDAFMAAWPAWSLKHLGTILPVTHGKDFYMIELWDDRAVGVVPNTGERADGLEE